METAAGAVFAPNRFSLVRISIRDLVADRKSLLRKSGVGGGGQILILGLWDHIGSKIVTENTKNPPNIPSETPKCGSGRMWDLGGRGRERKGPCTKQYAWRKHGSSDARLAEACPPKLRNTVKYRVEEMRPKWPFWKHHAPKMRLVEAQCAHRKHCSPEIPLGSHPTSRVSPNIAEILGFQRFEHPARHFHTSNSMVWACGLASLAKVAPNRYQASILSAFGPLCGKLCV